MKLDTNWKNWKKLDVEGTITCQCISAWEQLEDKEVATPVIVAVS